MGSFFSSQYPQYLTGISLSTTPKIQSQFYDQRNFCGSRKLFLIFYSLGVTLVVTLTLYQFVEIKKKNSDSNQTLLTSIIKLVFLTFCLTLNPIIEFWFPKSILRQRASHIFFMLMAIFNYSEGSSREQQVPF